MNEEDCLDHVPIDKIRRMLARDDIPLETLESFLANTRDPKIRKLLLEAIARLLTKTRAEVARKKDELAEAEQRQKRIEAILRQHAAELQDEDDSKPGSPRP